MANKLDNRKSHKQAVYFRVFFFLKGKVFYVCLTCVSFFYMLSCLLFLAIKFPSLFF